MTTSKESRQEVNVRQFKGLGLKALRIATFLFCVYNALFLLGLLTTRWIFINDEVHLPINLGIMLTFSFLLLPASQKSPKDRPAWYDFLLILLSLLGTIYIAANVLDIILIRVMPTFPELILGTATLIAVLEGVRRSIGWTVVLIVLFVIFYTLFPNLFPGVFWGPQNSWARILGQIWLFPTGMFGKIMRVTSTYIVLFVMLGAFLNVLGGGKFFLELSLALAGRFSGGPAKVAVIGSGFFGTLTGSALANVATTGVITIPLMKKIGYKPYYAGGIEAAASTGGIVMPPVMGFTAFVMADFMGVPYFSICVAAFIPAILYYIALFTQIHLQAKQRGMTGLPREDIPSIRKVLKQGYHYLVPLVVLLFYLGVMKYSATTSCLYSIGSLLLVSIVRKDSRWTLKTLTDGCFDTVRMLARLFPIAASAGALMACFEVTGLTLSLTNTLLQLSGGNIFVLLVLTAALCYIFGMGLPSMVAYIMMAILVIPALTKAGIPVMAAHMFVFYFAISHVITVPVCTAAFVAASIANGPMMRTGLQAMRLGIVAFIVPFAFVYSTNLLLDGAAKDIVLATLIAIVAVVSLGIGLEGYLLRPIGPLRRSLFVAAGAALMFPGTIFKSAGIVVILLTLLHEIAILVRGRPAKAVSVADRGKGRMS